MYVKFTKQTSAVKGLVDYLSKEDDMLEVQRDKILKSKNQEIKKCVDYLSKEIENGVDNDGFFTSDKDNVDADIVQFRIENNCKKLRIDENRFFMLNINPSKEEIEHIQSGVDMFCENNNITSDRDKEAIFRQHLKEFSNDVMDQYAQNYGRDGIDSRKDLVWYAKVEKYRYWKHDSKEVIENNKLFKQISVLEKKGAALEVVNELRDQLNKDQDRVIYSNMPKSGENWHVHTVISRKDITQKMKLSPLSQGQNSENHVVDGRQCKSGFNRVEFAKRVEAAFDKKFDYIRPYEQTIEARLQFGKIKTQNLKIKEAANTLRVGDNKEIAHFMVRSSSVSPQIKTITSAVKQKEWLVRETRIDGIQYDTTNRIWERLNPDSPKPFFKTMDGFKVGDKLRADRKMHKMVVFRNGLRLFPLQQNENFGVRQSGRLEPSIVNSYAQVLKSKDNLSLESVKYNVAQQIWEKENPNTPRPYYLTEKGQEQLIEIKQGKRTGSDISAVQDRYYQDRDMYNKLNGIKSQNSYIAHTQDVTVPKVTNYISSIGSSLGNSLFRELQFNDVSKVVRLSYGVIKAVAKTQKRAKIEAQFKASRWEKNSTTRVVVQKNKTVEVVMQNPISTTATNSVKAGANLSQTYAQQAATRTLDKIGKGVATKAMACVSPVLTPVKVISLATGLIKRLISNDLER